MKQTTDKLQEAAGADKATACRSRPDTSPQSGIIMIGALATMSFFMVVTLAVAEFGLSHFRSARRSLVALNALAAAEAGAERFMFEINKPGNNTYPGSGGPVVFYSDAVKGEATYETSVAPGSISNEKIVTSIGRIYLPAGSTEPMVTRKVKLTITGSDPSNYAIQTGPGGLIMTNSASIGYGTVHVNGYLTMSNSARIGSSSTPVKVLAAHVNCPSGGGSTYPEQCTSGQPISLTSPNAHIYGEVRATNQTNGAQMSNPGLIAGSSASPVGLPTHDRDAQKAAATITRSASDASCSGSQTKTWAAGTHITGGNVSLANNCEITVSGDVWIDGKLSLSQNSILRVANGLTASPNIMIDGAGVDALTLNNSAVVSANATVGFKFITYHSAATCSPDCTNVTGTDLYNSRDTRTIGINNNSVAAGSIFYARWSKVRLNNGGGVGSIIGQTVELANSGNVTFATDGVTGDSVWDVKRYQQVFD
ncbi:hypothetical protein KY386_01930 [Candidatus Parcubacteria bacterium]|nr:hypothetical protein [Candidatus Parcubacteria bacterium]